MRVPQHTLQWKASQPRETSDMGQLSVINRPRNIEMLLAAVEQTQLSLHNICKLENPQEP